MACFSLWSIKIKINFTCSLLIFANYLHDQKRRNSFFLIHPKFSPKKISHTDTFDTFQQFSQPPPYRSLVNYATIEENKIKFFVPRYFRTIETRKRKRVVVLRSRFQNSNRRGLDSPSFNRVLLNGGKAAKHQTSPLKFPRKEAWSLSLSLVLASCDDGKNPSIVYFNIWNIIPLIYPVHGIFAWRKMKLWRGETTCPLLFLSSRWISREISTVSVF